MEVSPASSDNLIENNIFEKVTDSTPNQNGGAAGNVIGYNYTVSTRYTAASGWFQASDYEHASGNDFWLREGNQGLGFVSDNVHGTHHFTTLFRNFYTGTQATCNGVPCSAQTDAIQLYGGSRYFNVVGNVLGTTGTHNRYESIPPSGTNGNTAIYTLGWTGNGGSTDTNITGFCLDFACTSRGNRDPLTALTLMRWGNWDVISNATRFVAGEVPSGLSLYANPLPASNALPASFYLASRPVWWSGAIPYPAIGPDVTGGNITGTGGFANNIPARVCYAATSATGGILNFDANACYYPTTIPPSIVTQPNSQSITTGNTANLSVSAAGSATLTYQWYQGASGNTSTPLAGATSSTLITPVLTVTTSFWVRVTNLNGTADSNAATITVSAVIPPSITTHPASASIASGATANLSVAATGGIAPLAYQWYQGASGVTTTPLAGATSSSLTTPALTSTTSFWVRVTNSGGVGSADSNAATVTVIPLPSITTHPASTSIPSGATANLSVAAAGGIAPLTYQWYQGASGVTTTPLAGATSSSFTTPALTSTTSFWVRVTNSGGVGSADSNAATVTVIPLPSITTHPASTSIPSGATANLSVVATGGIAPLAYQWYQGASGVTTTPVAGATSSSFTTPALTSTTSFWARVTNSGGVGSADSNAATITVTGAPFITSHPGSQTISTGSTANLSVVATGTATLSYQWYQGPSGATTTPISGATSATFTTPALTSTTSYWVRVTNGLGTADSATATLTVGADLAPPSVTILIPVDGAVVSGNAVVVSASATDDVAVRAVWFTLDGAPLGSILTSPPYSVVWNTTLIADGPHALTANAEDTAGRKAPPFSITVRVGNLTTNYSIPPSGGQSFNVTGSSNATSDVTHARIDGGTNSPTGVAIIDFESGTGQQSALSAEAATTVLTSQAGVPATVETRTGTAYVDIGGSVNTGVAIANETASNAVIDYTFTDASGTTVKQGSLTLFANNQMSTFLNAPPFNVPAPFTGTFSFTSSVPVAVIATRNLTNERNEFVFSTMPIATTAPSADPLLPIFADGGGWNTQVILTNDSTSAMNGSVEFFSQGTAAAPGTPMTMTVNGKTDTAFPYSIPPRSMFRMVTQGLGSAATLSGSVRITSTVVNPFSPPFPNAFAILSYKSNNVTVSETSVFAVSTGSAFRMFVESAGSTQGQILSGIAVANSSATPTTVALELTKLDGSAVGGVQSFSLSGKGEISKFLNEMFPTLPSDFKGVLRITSTAPVGVVDLRARYNSRNDFLVTTMPPANQNAPETRAVVFPHLVSGGGYKTQIILFGQPAGSATGALSFTSTNGTPVVGAATTTP